MMKQLNRSDEAIEAIKSFRHLCPFDSQESLDNVLIELYKVMSPIHQGGVVLLVSHVDHFTLFFDNVGSLCKAKLSFNCTTRFEGSCWTKTSLPS